LNWMNLPRKIKKLAQDVRGVIRVAPKVAKRERSSSSAVTESAPLLQADSSPDSGQQAANRQPRSRRAERISSWRRRALSRKGAQLYSAMRANSQAGSLAMLDEGGIVIAWYERAESNDSTYEGVVDTHMSQFYVAEDQALGLPVRDLCSAAIHGRSTQAGWRRFPRGTTCWATTVIEPIWLRDGRLQGFSHVTRRSSDATENMRAEKPRPSPHFLSIRAHAVAHSGAMLAALAPRVSA